MSRSDKKHRAVPGYYTWSHNSNLHYKQQINFKLYSRYDVRFVLKLCID